jgi:hypothetical protein
MEYSEKEIMSLTGKSHQRLNQLRSGFKQKKADKEYFIRPMLEKGNDWFFSPDDGTVRYRESALEKMQQKKKTLGDKTEK